MLGILITVAVIAVVAYCVLKNYYPPIVLLLAGLLMLVCAWLMGVDPVDAKKSTNFVGFDFVQAFTNQMKGRLPGLGRGQASLERIYGDDRFHKTFGLLG